MTDRKTRSEQRRHRRALCSHLIRAAFEDDAGRTIVQTALLEDISPAGAALSIALPVNAGRQVRLSAEGFEAVALVRRCQVRESDYLLGLEFVGEHVWDRTRWSPGHLYSPFEE